jgi:hypothetical protein
VFLQDDVWGLDVPHRASMCPHVSQRRILTNASSTVRLDRAVQRLEQGLGDEDLGLGDFFTGGAGVGVVNADGGVQDN